MSPPIRDGSGSSIGSIRLGDGSEIAEVRTGAGDVVFSAIPDSESNQKLIHRWYLSAQSDPFNDQIGSIPLSQGVGEKMPTRVTGDYVDDAAREGDGTDEALTTGSTMGSFGSDMDRDFAIAFTIDNFTSSSSDETAMGVVNDSDMRFAVNTNASGDGDVELEMVDSDASTFRGQSSSGLIDDGNKHRVVVNKIANNDFEVWVDQSEKSVSIGNNQGFSNTKDFDSDLYVFARNDSGSRDRYFSAVLDDICMFDNSLTQSEIQSYNNPWS